MNNPIDKILTEWAYRVHDGMPNPKNDYHVVQLQEYLNELRLPRRVVKKVLEKVRRYKDNKMNQDLGRVGKPWGSKGTDKKDKTQKKKHSVNKINKPLDVDFNINHNMATLTFVEILKQQKHYLEALHVLTLIEEKSSDTKQTQKLKTELNTLISES